MPGLLGGSGRIEARRVRLFTYLRLVPILVVPASFTNSLMAQSYDAAATFEQGWINQSNPNGVWSYGYSSSFTAPITLYTQTVQNGVNGPNAQYWLSPSVNTGTSPAAEFNNGPAFDDGNVNFLANQFILVAGIGGQYSDLVFTAPADGTYSVVGSFRGDQYGVGTVVGIVANGTVLFNSSVTAVGQVVPFNAVVGLKAGTTVVFSVGPGGGTQNTGLSVTITGSAGTGPQPLQITSTTLPSATSGQAYSATLAATGGSGTGYTWSLTSGSLPSGFALSSAGVLSSTGSPVAPARSYVFTIQVQDSAGNLASNVFTLIINSLVTQSCVAPPSGLIAWWPFDETSGTIANDIAGNSPGSYVNSPVPVPGEVGEALSLNGTNYVGVVDSNLWDYGTQDFTVEFWANFPVVPGGSIGEPGAIFIGHDQGGGSLNKWFFAMGGGVLDFTVYNTAQPPPNGFLVRAPFAPIVGQWYHLAVTKAGTTFTIYVNGVAVGSEVSPSPIATASAPLTIGQAEDIGFTNGLLDEMSIYNRALSQAELYAIANAAHAGKCKQLTITTPSLSAVQLGTPFSQQLQASFGVPPYTWSVLSGSLPSGVTLSTNGVLTGTSNSAGQSALTIGVTDSTNSQAHETFTLTSLVTLPPPTLRITKAGTQAVPGLTSDYFILVENIGTTTATNVPVVEFLQPQNFTLKSVNPPAVVDVPTLAEASIIPWNIASLTPGQSTILEYQVEVNPTVPVGQTVTGTACDVGKLYKDWGTCVLAVSGQFATCPNCPKICSQLLLCTLVVIPEVWPLCANAIARCGGCLILCSASSAVADYQCNAAAQSPAQCYSFPSPTGASRDPNQKTVTAGQYIQPSQLLLYPIQYENDGNAAARNVYVTDVLDLSLDASTLQIITPNGVYDPATRTLTWNLLGTNLQPGATADVLFSILPLPNLASGTAINNTATITFDVNPPMTTNQVTNIIDRTPPVSTMGKLPWRTFAPNFPITWSGTDAIGKIAAYTIFESVNGGPFTPYLENTTDTQASFTGLAGNTYGFISIATDTAGNVEVEQPVSEATILVSLPGDVNGDGVVNCTDVAIVKAAFGKKVGQPGYNMAADVNNDGVVNLLDLAFVTQHLPAGTKCQ
jgi:uncharacterized repeat protein (TIGR01451 family)